MNSFLKQVLATVVGLILVCIIFTIISIVSLAGMIASNSTATSIDENSVLRIKLQGTIEERASEENPLAILTGNEITTIGLDQAMEAISKAAKNDNIQGIYLEGGILAATPAMM
ncbi:MAG: signal peptide peptidase SppA, partial [Bacteroidaceae bacterium]|nr:signal peptide peptidase SppA [Bacteroidaceae bacterium]